MAFELNRCFMRGGVVATHMTLLCKPHGAVAVRLVETESGVDVPVCVDESCVCGYVEDGLVPVGLGDPIESVTFFHKP